MAAMESQPLPVLLRRYPASSYDSALDSYASDLLAMAEAGYFPVGQSWGWDVEGDSALLVGGSSWKPGMGTLAVTYRRDPSPPR
jgi:hypothetical protein